MEGNLALFHSGIYPISRVERGPEPEKARMEERSKAVLAVLIWR